ncbi:Hypothetical predicted protein [Marmota monax]|uniref:Adropin n=1 Tax=Marmota monax TaxID=9995 RepID=A0A5E4BA45_MARMO|nr:adropin [Marmota monax]VTJ65771.1 Hypothetical predicted protein [Marmota monax]
MPPGSGLQVGISTAQESLREPPWKAAVLEFLLGMGLAIEAAPLSGALIAIVCNGLVGFLLLLLWVILCWACHSRSADVDSLSESSPNSSPGPCPEKAPPPQKPSHEGSYLLQP